ncbi:MAG: hypothetical protein ABW007_06575 [Chitinophagaceae bacterium]
MKEVTGNAAFQEREARCPDCRGLMANMGKDFEAPPRKQLKKWQHIKELYSVGIAFHSCGCYGPGYIPANRERLIAYLREDLEKYYHQLDFWRNRMEPKTQQEIDRDRSKNGDFLWRVSAAVHERNKTVRNEDAKKYWFERITELETKLAKIQAS